MSKNYKICSAVIIGLVVVLGFSIFQIFQKNEKPASGVSQKRPNDNTVMASKILKSDPVNTDKNSLAKASSEMSSSQSTDETKVSNNVVEVNMKTPISEGTTTYPFDDLPLPDFGTNLSPQEVGKAIDEFSTDRAMWAQIKSIAGEVKISISDDEAVTGVIELRKIEVERSKRGLPWVYQLTIKGKDDKWVFISDGTRKGTKIQCEDNTLTTKLRTILDGLVVTEITFPQTVLLSAYVDDLFPYMGERKLKSEQDFFEGVQPWRNPDANGTEDSYSFQVGLVPENVLSFKDGHVSSWSKGLRGLETAKLTFDSYVKSKDLFFPTKITSQMRGKRIRQYQFENIEINTLNTEQKED